MPDNEPVQRPTSLSDLRRQMRAGSQPVADHLPPLFAPDSSSRPLRDRLLSPLSGVLENVQNGVSGFLQDVKDGKYTAAAALVGGAGLRYAMSELLHMDMAYFDMLAKLIGPATFAARVAIIPA